MQYNESQYNGDSYNLTGYTSTLTETIAPSDATVTKAITAVKTDSQGTADAISDGVSLAAMLDTVTIYQKAHTPFAYNNGMYNAFMYNVRADEDEILLMAQKLLDGDFVFIADVMAPFTVQKNMSETISDIDTVVFSGQTEMVEVVIIDETGFRIEVSNKALDATVRVNDWLDIRQNPQSNNWGD